ncbi:Uncharacterised protein [Bordetella pertussis]|nr:Uncharacterised protein [Bordetella pertussis]CFW37299.1 Uncharacterised protein [Bordetella pertussis]
MVAKSAASWGSMGSQMRKAVELAKAASASSRMARLSDDNDMAGSGGDVGSPPPYPNGAPLATILNRAGGSRAACGGP